MKFWAKRKSIIWNLNEDIALWTHRVFHFQAGMSSEKSKRSGVFLALCAGQGSSEIALWVLKQSQSTEWSSNTITWTTLKKKENSSVWRGRPESPKDQSATETAFVEKIEAVRVKPSLVHEGHLSREVCQRRNNLPSLHSLKTSIVEQFAILDRDGVIKACRSFRTLVEKIAKVKGVSCLA